MKNNWPVKKLGEVVDINPPKSEISNLAMGTAVSFVSMAAINENVGTISNMQTKKLEDVKNGYTFFADNDVLFAKITPCMENGKIAIAQNLQNGIGFGTTEIHVLRPTNQVLPEWIYSNVSRDQFRAEAKRHMTGSAGQQRVSKDFLENVKISVPPVNSQKKIVERLDTIRKAQELCEEQIQKTEELFETLLIKSFENIELEKNLDEVCKVIGGGTPSRSNRDFYTGDIPWITVKDLKSNEIEDSLEHVTLDAIKNSAANKIPANTVLVATRVGLGKMGITKRELCFNQDIKALICFSEIIPNYLLFFLLTKAKDIEGAGHGFTVKGINQEFLKRIKVPVTSLIKQQKIVEKLEAVQNYKKLLQKQKSLLKELFDSVLDKSMKGELD